MLWENLFESPPFVTQKKPKVEEFSLTEKNINRIVPDHETLFYKNIVTYLKWRINRVKRLFIQKINILQNKMNHHSRNTALPQNISYSMYSFTFRHIYAHTDVHTKGSSYEQKRKYVLCVCVCVCVDDWIFAHCTVVRRVNRIKYFSFYSLVRIYAWEQMLSFQWRTWTTL